MVNVFKTVLVYLSGVSVAIFGGAVLIGNTALNYRLMGAALVIVGVSIAILSGIFDRKKRKTKPNTKNYCAEN